MGSQQNRQKAVALFKAYRSSTLIFHLKIYSSKSSVQGLGAPAVWLRNRSPARTVPTLPAKPLCSLSHPNPGYGSATGQSAQPSAFLTYLIR